MSIRLASWLFVVWIMAAGPSESADLQGDHEDYRLGPNDVLRILVYGEDDLSVEAKVEDDGHITYLLLGVLKVGGFTAKGLQYDLTSRLEAGYVRHPKVMVSIARHRNFYLGGEVKTPGVYSYEEGLTVQKAIALAGGLTEKADKQLIMVTRLGASGLEVVSLQSDAVLRPDDLVTVPQSKKFYINGEIRRAGDYPYERDLTVHRAVTMAGGFTDKAVTSHAKVIRKYEGQERTLSVDLDGLVLPDDIIVVSRSFF